MKRIIYNTILIAVVVMTSCQKEVTEINPTDRLSSDLAFSSPAKIDNSVLGVYNSLQSANYLSGRALIYVDLMADDIYDLGNFFGAITQFNMLSNSGTASTTWNAGYNVIADANRVITGIAANAGLLTGNRAKELTAECLFMRAVSNFYLVNFFAQPYEFTAGATHVGIPIITGSFNSNDPAANKPRATVAEVYAAIISDLNTALTDLPATQSTLYSTKTRATKGATAAMLARVYLYKADYANAKSISDKIIAGDYGTFALRPNPENVFGPGNYQTSETIWSVSNSATDNPNTNNALPQHYYPSGRGDLAVSATFRNAGTNPYFAADDKRRKLIINGVGANATAFFTAKYPDVATRADWAPILRYAEVLLTNAEASARLSAVVDAGAVTRLNMVRDRSRVSAAQYTLLSFTTKTDLIAAIMAERRIELAFEGHRFWDLMRTKSAVTNKYNPDGNTLVPVQPYGDPKNIFPIPQIEIDKSKGVLLQNPGY